MAQRIRRPVTVYLLPAVKTALEVEAKRRGRKTSAVAAEILTTKLLLPPTPDRALNPPKHAATNANLTR